MDSRYLGALRVVNKDGSSSFYEIPERMTIGRSSKNTLIVTGPDVSRRHAEIRMFRPGRYFLFESQSRNGTLINDIRVVGSQELLDGDVIVIGSTFMRFIAPTFTQTRSEVSEITDATPTALGMTYCTVVVLMSDIRNYTELTRKLADTPFQQFVANWFKGVISIVEKNKGTIDRIAGDAIMAYWVAKDEQDPSSEVALGIDTASKMVNLMKEKSLAFSELAPDDDFRIGIGLNAGPAAKINLGDRAYQAFTVVGNCVNLTARLESLTKIKKCLVITTKEIERWAPKGTRFRDLGEEMVRGRAEPLRILAIEVE